MFKQKLFSIITVAKDIVCCHDTKYNIRKVCTTFLIAHLVCVEVYVSTSKQKKKFEMNIFGQKHF